MQKSLVYVFPASFVLAAALSAVPAFAREQPLPSEDAGSALSQDQAEQAGKPQAGPQGMPPQGGRPKSVFDGDWVTIGMGAGYRPSYEGSDDYNIGPAPLIQGSVSGFEFGARGPGLYVDLVRDSDSKSNIKFAAGPQILARLDRNGRIKDDVVEALGKRDVAIELGFTAGVSFEKLVNPFDRLTISLDAGWDVAGAHDGNIIRPSVSYSTPLSRALFANLSLSASRVDDNYAAAYYNVDSAGSTASGLPIFTADGGWKDAGAFMVLGYDLSGNALDGGFGLFALGSYNRLLGDAKRTPITSIRGDANQWFVGGGVAYTF